MCSWIIFFLSFLSHSAKECSFCFWLYHKPSFYVYKTAKFLSKGKHRDSLGTLPTVWRSCSETQLPHAVKPHPLHAEPAAISTFPSPESTPRPPSIHGVQCQSLLALKRLLKGYWKKFLFLLKKSSSPSPKHFPPTLQWEEGGRLWDNQPVVIACGTRKEWLTAAAAAATEKSGGCLLAFPSPTCLSLQVWGPTCLCCHHPCAFTTFLKTLLS